MASLSFILVWLNRQGHLWFRACLLLSSPISHKPTHVIIHPSLELHVGTTQSWQGFLMGLLLFQCHLLIFSPSYIFFSNLSTSFPYYHPDGRHHHISLGLLKQFSNQFPCTHFCSHSLVINYCDFLKYKFNCVLLKLFTGFLLFLA